MATERTESRKLRRMHEWSPAEALASWKASPDGHCVTTCHDERKQLLAALDEAIVAGAFDGTHECASNVNADTTAHLAVRLGAEIVLEALIAAGASLNGTNSNGRTVLHYAAEIQSASMCSLIVSRNKGLCSVGDRIGWTPLDLAAQIGTAKVCDVLIDAAPDTVNRAAVDGTTPLTRAAVQGWVIIVQELLNAGADPVGAYISGEHLLFHVLRSTNAPKMLALLADSFDVPTLQRLHSNAWHSLLHAAAWAGTVEGLRILLAKGLDAESSCACAKQTPLHIVAAKGSQEMWDMLINAGANHDSTNAHGHTPVETATPELKDYLQRAAGGDAAGVVGGGAAAGAAARGAAGAASVAAASPLAGGAAATGGAFTEIPKPRFGIVCALPLELAAVTLALDEDLGTEAHPHDDNIYQLGYICKHVVVCACLPVGNYGEENAAIVAANMQRSYSLDGILLVGIAGGVPNSGNDVGGTEVTGTTVQLGDVVVGGSNGGKAIVQYDFGKTLADGKLHLSGHLPPASRQLLHAVAMVQRNALVGKNELEMHLRNIMTAPGSTIRRPAADIVYPRDFVHTHTSDRQCAEVRPGGITRPAREVPAVHNGIIASANRVMKNAIVRDEVAREHNVICFEMEAAGVAVAADKALVIRGICDYCDSHKNNDWQPYAAAAAAAYLKCLMSALPP